MKNESKTVYLSVIIPSYNETENLRRGVLNEVYDYLSHQNYSWEVIISDDGSPNEESRVLAKEFADVHKNVRFLQNEHAGKPFAVWSGIQNAYGEIVLFTDMDQSTPIKEIEKLLPKYSDGFDVVIGSRGGERKNTSAFRKLASFLFTGFRRTLLLRNVVDTQAGFKSLKAKVAKEIFPQMQIIKYRPTNVSGWKVGSFDVEMLFLAQKRGYKIAEIPVEWLNRDLAMDTKKSSNKGKFIKESIDMLKEILRVKLNDLTGYYKI